MAVTSVTKSNLTSSIWKNFYDRIQDQVTSVTITGSTIVTIQTYTGAFSDKMLDVSSNYPIVVVNTPKIPTSEFTFGKKEVDGQIKIDIYTTQNEAAEKFMSAVFSAIETYTDLSSVGFRDIEVLDSDITHAERGEIKLHMASITFSYKINVTKQGY